MLQIKNVIPLAMMSMMSFQTMALDLELRDVFAEDGIQIGLEGPFSFLWIFKC